MQTFHLTIAGVGESLWEGEASAITIMTLDGQVTILPNHAPLVAPTKMCTALVQDEKAHSHDIELPTEGVLEVSNNQVTVLL